MFQILLSITYLIDTIVLTLAYAGYDNLKVFVSCIIRTDRYMVSRIPCIYYYKRASGF